MPSSNAFARFVSRQLLFVFLCVLTILVFWPVLKPVLELALRDERYTYILAVPTISAAFFYSEKERIFRNCRYCPAIGVPLMLLGVLIFVVSGMRQSSSGNMTFPAVSMVLVLVGAFTLCYGLASLRSGAFPVWFLLLIVPIPSSVLDRAVAVLQVGSAELTYFLFRATGVPVMRHGMVMSLPGVDIEVAQQCSGIRSTMALFMAGAVVSRVLLRTGWARVLALLCLAPIGMFRNAVRIVSISLLGVYVDHDFFVGSLHRQGGIPFSLVGFAILIPLVWLLRRWEMHMRGVWLPATARKRGSI
jgi:exosortase